MRKHLKQQQSSSFAIFYWSLSVKFSSLIQRVKKWFFFLDALPSCSITPASKGFNDEEKKAIVDVHNKFRQQVSCFIEFIGVWFHIFFGWNVGTSKRCSFILFCNLYRQWYNTILWISSPVSTFSLLHAQIESSFSRDNTFLHYTSPFWPFIRTPQCIFVFSLFEPPVALQSLKICNRIGGNRTQDAWSTKVKRSIYIAR